MNSLSGDSQEMQGKARRKTKDATSSGQEQLDDLQKNVLARLRRIEGQIRGIQGMVLQGKECEDILIQVKAVSSALKSTSRQILKRYLKVCHTKAMESADSEMAYKQLEETVKVLTHFIEG